MEIDKEFLVELRALDQTLNARFDNEQDAICVWSERSGQRDLILVAKREFGQLYNELKHAVLVRLREMDIWKKFGTGAKYDDWLAEQEDKARAKIEADNKDKRMRALKANRRHVRNAMLNAASGRLTEDETFVMERPFTAVPSNFKLKKSKALKG